MVDKQKSEKSNKNQLSNDTLPIRLHFTNVEPKSVNFVLTWIGVGIWIAEELAAGVVGAIGAGIWTRLMNKYDLEDLHNDIAKEFKKMLNQQFDMLKFEEAMTYITIAHQRIHDYTLSPSEEDLNRALDNSYEGLIRLMRLKNYSGIGNFAIAAGIHLAILQEQAKTNHSKKNVIKDFVNGPRPDRLSFKEYLIDAEDYIINNWLPSRFSSAWVDELVDQDCEGAGGGRRFSLDDNPIEFFACRVHSAQYTSYYEFDGKKHRVNIRKLNNIDDSFKKQLRKEAETAKNEHLEQLREEFNEKILDPAFEMHKLWKKSYIFS